MDKEALLTELRRLLAVPGALDYNEIDKIVVRLGGGDGTLQDLWYRMHCGDVSDEEWRGRFGEHAFEVAIAVQATAIERFAAAVAGDPFIGAVHYADSVIVAHRRVRRLDPH